MTPDDDLDFDDVEVPNVITPRQFAVILIERELADVRDRISRHDRQYPPGADLFHSQIRVWLHRAVEELEAAAQYLHDRDDPE